MDKIEAAISSELGLLGEGGAPVLGHHANLTELLNMLQLWQFADHVLARHPS